MNTPNPKRPVLAKILALVAILTLVVGVFAIPCFANGHQEDVEEFYIPHPLTPYAFGYNGSTYRYRTNSYAYPRGITTAFTDVDTFYIRGTGFTERTVLLLGPQNENQRILATFTPNVTVANATDYGYCAFYWGGFKYDRDTNARNYLPTIRLDYDTRYEGEYLTVHVEGTGIDYDDAGNRNGIEIYDYLPYNVTPRIEGLNAYYYVDMDSVLSYITSTYDLTEFVELSVTFLPKTSDGNVNVDVTLHGYYMEYSVINEYTPLDTLNTTHTVYRQIINSGDAGDFVSLMTDWVSDLFTTPLFHFGYVPVTIGAILSVATAVALTMWLLKLFLGG